jgi:hypothetical protein
MRQRRRIVAVVAFVLAARCSSRATTTVAAAPTSATPTPTSPSPTAACVSKDDLGTAAGHIQKSISSFQQKIRAFNVQGAVTAARFVASDEKNLADLVQEAAPEVAAHLNRAADAWTHIAAALANFHVSEALSFEKQSNHELTLGLANAETIVCWVMSGQPSPRSSRWRSSCGGDRVAVGLVEV